MADWQNDLGQSLLVLQPGSIRLGRGLTVTSENGFHGWLDDFKVVGQAETMTVEEICNNALGSLVGLGLNAPQELINEAETFPSEFIASVAASGASGFPNYICFDHNKNQDGWADIKNLPNDVVSLRGEILFPEGPLMFSSPRPDSSSNSFCLTCHTQDGSSSESSFEKIDTHQLVSCCLKLHRALIPER